MGGYLAVCSVDSQWCITRVLLPSYLDICGVCALCDHVRLPQVAEAPLGRGYEVIVCFENLPEAMRNSRLQS